MTAFALSACGGRADLGETSETPSYVGKWRAIEATCSGPLQLAFAQSFEFGVDSLTSELSAPGCKARTQSTVTVNASTVSIDPSTIVVSCDPSPCSATVSVLYEGHQTEAGFTCDPKEVPDTPAPFTYERQGDKLIVKPGGSNCVATFVKE